MEKKEKRKALFYYSNIVALLSLVTVVMHSPTFAQQLPDTTFHYSIKSPVYSRSKGPYILIDEVHNNIHTANGKYSPLKQLLETDGYRVEGLTNDLTKKALAKCRILIISNALDSSNVSRWILPTPSAFPPEEIALLQEWVKKGGRLFLITDHMPCAGAMSDLAAVFGFKISNGFVSGAGIGDYIRFSLRNEGLTKGSITKGRNPSEEVDSVATFTGCAFRIPQKAQRLLTFKGDFISLMPDTAWKFSRKTPRMNIEGWCQGAVLEHGRGRVAMFGEAGMFTAQLGGSSQTKMGFNSPHAPQNVQFTLNLIHWLDGILE